MSEREPAPHEPTLPLSGPAPYPPPGDSPGPVPDAGAPYAGAPYALPGAGAGPMPGTGAGSMPGTGAPYPPPGGPPYALPGGPPYAPPGGAMGPVDGPVIAQIGELAVTSSTVHTPAGSIPLRGSTWQVNDQWMTVQKIPTWAIVMAIVGFCFLTFFSLLFLLVKETVYKGVVNVTVGNGPQQYVSRIPVTNQGQVHYINQQVNYVRSLATL